MATQQNIPLSDNHRRAVTTMLTLMDQRLCELELIAQGREVQSLFYREQNDLTAAQRRRILKDIADAREAMREVRDALRSEPRVEKLSRHVRATSSSLWESLVETQSKRLGGYGKVPRDLAQYLDPRLQRLIDCVLNINSVTEGREGDQAPEADE